MRRYQIETFSGDTALYECNSPAEAMASAERDGIARDRIQGITLLRTIEEIEATRAKLNAPPEWAASLARWMVSRPVPPILDVPDVAPADVEYAALAAGACNLVHIDPALIEAAREANGIHEMERARNAILRAVLDR